MKLYNTFSYRRWCYLSTWLDQSKLLELTTLVTQALFDLYNPFHHPLFTVSSFEMAQQREKPQEEEGHHPRLLSLGLLFILLLFFFYFSFIIQTLKGKEIMSICHQKCTVFINITKMNHCSRLMYLDHGICYTVINNGED